jgi:signal transduction histidine kinase
VDDDVTLAAMLQEFLELQGFLVATVHAGESALERIEAAPPDLLVLAAVRDVTDRRRLTDELRAARAEAESANQAKSRFLATASHDLRQPLQTLQLLNATLARRLADSTNQDILARQQAALDSMADLLNALLDVTKLESGALKPNLVQVRWPTCWRISGASSRTWRGPRA